MNNNRYTFFIYCIFNNLVSFPYSSLVQLVPQHCFNINQNVLSLSASLNCRIVEISRTSSNLFATFSINGSQRISTKLCTEFRPIIDTFGATPPKLVKKQIPPSPNKTAKKNHIKPIKVSNSFEQVFCQGVQSTPLDIP